MECEICGKEIEEAVKVEIDRVEFQVCPGCAKHGREIKNEPKVIVHKAEPEPAPQTAQPSFSPNPLPGSPAHFAPARVKGQVSGDDELVLAPDFGKIIQRHRAKQDLTLEELAKKLFEKESTIRRVESQKATPRDELVNKLEKFFGVKLRKKIENDDV